jgi:hypothetical protein
MKPPAVRRKATVRTGDIKKDLSTEQLAGIGAVAVAYNYAETMIDQMMVLALNVPEIIASHINPHITSRINGVDGKIAIVKLCAEHLGLAEDIRLSMAEARGTCGFGVLKGYRDAVIHARVLDSNLQLGERLERQGRRHEVLLSAVALEGLFQRLDELKVELAGYAIILTLVHWINELRERDPADPEIARSQQDIREYYAQALEHRTARLSLPPLPEFPEQPAVLQLRFRAEDIPSR